MSSCCYSEEYGERFSEKEARRTARRFRRKGLRGSAGALAAGLAATGVDGATVLEVGGGVGGIQAHLLRSGAARAVNVELSPSWEGAARRLFAELGLGDRVERHVADFVDLAGQLPEADLVVLHRVVCCYPDWRAMLGAAAGRTRRALGMTLPRDRWWTRATVAVGNGFFALRRRDFRAYVHPVAPMLDALRQGGLQVVGDSQGPVWRTLILARE
ncbi:MAG TPA: methyltransferase domain-containing protein [Thermoanaerobaculia bacterium]|nr:methyltransferase domain-containing protein [Thermoanaerobaculia bacterium]